RRQEQGQHRLSFELSIGPTTSVNSYFDWLGNAVHTFTINSFHRELKIAATSVVETERLAADPLTAAAPWPCDNYDYTCWDYLQFGGPITDSPALRELAASLELTKGMSFGQVVGRMLDAIRGRFTYEKGVTNAASPITEVLEHGRGV